MKFVIPVKPGRNTYVNLRTLGIYQDGGYSYYFLVPNYKHLIKLEEVDFNSSAALACSGLTAYTSIKKTLAMPGENLDYWCGRIRAYGSSDRQSDIEF